MKKSLLVVAVLASFSFSTTNVIAGPNCLQRDTDKDNKVTLPDNEICCCRPIEPGSNKHECEPVIVSVDPKEATCPETRSVKLSMKIAGIRVCICEYTKK